MNFTDEGIILSVRKYSERDAVVSVLTPQHGIYRAIAKGALSKTQRGTYQPGNFVHAKWNARLAEHMGTLTCELTHPVAALIMQDALALAALTSVCSLVETALHERDPHPGLYGRVRELLEVIAENSMGSSPLGGEQTSAASRGGYQKDKFTPHASDFAQERSSSAAPPQGGSYSSVWLPLYIHFELALLAETGFGLDLTRCAVTGNTADLKYVSPKSGRAVCCEAGTPYKEKLLPLPQFMLPPCGGADDAEARRAEAESWGGIPPTLRSSSCGLDLSRSPTRGEQAEILDALRLTGYFLAARLFPALHRKLPEARGRLVERMMKDTIAA